MRIVRLFGIILIISLNISCTVYQHRYEPIADSEPNRDKIKNLINVDDKARIKLKTGKIFSGKVTEINEDFLKKQERPQLNYYIYYDQISKIKYEKNVPLTILKSTGVILVGTYLLLVLAVGIYVATGGGLLGGF